MQGLHLPSALGVGYGNNSGSSSGLSSEVWKKFAANANSNDGSSAFFAGDDFLVFGESVAVSSNIACYVGAAGQYKAYIDTTSTLAQLATERGGVISLSLEAADNEEISICQGGAGTAAATSVLGAIHYDTAASRKLTAFESRFRVSSVADDVNAFFIGLMEENGAVHNAKTDNAGATIDNDFIGFETVHVNSGTAGTNALLKFVYKKDGQTQVTVGTVATLTAATWYKVGFVYDPFGRSGPQIIPYLNGVALPTLAVSATSLDAATFPDGEEMGFTAITKSGAATASTFDIDWWMAGFDR